MTRFVLLARYFSTPLHWAARFRSTRRDGFTFVELLLAVVILGIGLIMVASVFPVSADQQRRAFDEANAVKVARYAFGTLEQRLRQNFFTPPGTFVAQNSTETGNDFADFTPTQNRPPAKNVETEQWPVGMWAFDYKGTPGDPTDLKNYWLYRPSITGQTQNFPSTPGFPVGSVSEANCAPFALDQRISEQDRAFPPSSRPEDAEWFWDYALRIDRGTAVHAVVFIYRVEVRGTLFLDPNRVSFNPDLRTFYRPTLTDRIDANSTSSDLMRASFSESTGATFGPQMLANGPVWFVDRTGDTSTGIGVGRIFRLEGWRQGVSIDAAPILTGGWPRDLLGPNNQSSARPVIMTRVRTMNTNDYSTTDPPGEKDPTVAVYSTVLRFR